MGKIACFFSFLRYVSLLMRYGMGGLYVLLSGCRWGVIFNLEQRTNMLFGEDSNSSVHSVYTEGERANFCLVSKSESLPSLRIVVGIKYLSHRPKRRR